MMIRNATIALGAVLLLAGCAQMPSDGPPAKPGMTSGIAGITVEGAARVAATDGFEAKRRIVLETCAAAGLAVRSRGFARCVTAYFAIDAARAKAQAKALSERTARRHGLCVDPIRFELARCIEI